MLGSVISYRILRQVTYVWIYLRMNLWLVLDLLLFDFFSSVVFVSLLNIWKI